MSDRNTEKLKNIANSPGMADLVGNLGVEVMLDIAKDYESLQARIKVLEEQNRWIPVEDRLPEDKGYIDAYCIDTKRIDQKYWENTNSDAYVLKQFFTHWRPINPPKENPCLDATS